MRIDEQLYRWGRDEPVGRLIWDSDTGLLEGSAAQRVAEAIGRVVKAGAVGIGPQFWCSYNISDPLHRPEEMAAVLGSSGFRLPASLAAVYPQAPEEDEDVPDDAER